MLTQALLLILQSYSGPPPAKADVPYLLQAGELIATEVASVKTIPGVHETIYSVPGLISPVKTPLASPIFILRVDKLPPEQVQVWALASRNGQRELTFSTRAKPEVFTLTIQKLKGSLYRLEVNESMPNGQYCLSLRNANQAFCFGIY